MKAEHPELGAALKALKEARGVSQARLSKISGVSRRHVSVALGGGNVTIRILKRLMRALRAESIPIGDVKAVSGQVDGIDPAVLLSVADQLEQGIGVISAAATSLRLYAQPATTTTPDSVNEKAAALVNDFAARMHQISDPAELAAVQRAFAEVLSSDTPARAASAKQPKRRRRQS